MASREEMTLPASRPPKTRRSLAAIPNTAAMDQENLTSLMAKDVSTQRSSKKLRSKSIGPGGLDALASVSGNRRKSLSVLPQPLPRSILKSAAPINKADAFSNDAPSTQPSRQDRDVPKATGMAATHPDENALDPFHIDMGSLKDDTRVFLRTEEEQQAAARDREAKDRSAAESDATSRREARRKSLANRRVSFAPEATLHTWDVVVEYQDSTTSSNSTTRRASAGGSLVPGTPASASSDPSETPSTPSEEVEEDTVKASPAHQRDLHQKKRRRSSGVPPLDFNNPNDVDYSSSPDGRRSVHGADDDSEDSETSDSDAEQNGEGDEDFTGVSLATAGTVSSGGSTARLDESLRLAVQQADTQDLGNGSESIFHVGQGAEMAEKDSLWPFSADAQSNLMDLDKENINPFSPAFKAGAGQSMPEADITEELTMEMTKAGGAILTGPALEDDMSMDVTHAIGGIIPSTSQIASMRQLSTRPRQSIGRRTSEARSSLGDETMDLTTTLGGIQPTLQASAGDVEDMTMEFTTAVGGVLPLSDPKMQLATRESLSRSLNSEMDDTQMEMTTAIGGIIPMHDVMVDEQEQIVPMDMTVAVGGIMPQGTSSVDRATAKKMMEIEADPASSPFRIETSTNHRTAPVMHHTSIAETCSPSLAAFHGKGLRRSTGPRPRSSQGTPTKQPATPVKRITPSPTRPASIRKASPSKSIGTTPVKQASAAKTPDRVATSRMSPSKGATPNRLFNNDLNGMTTPKIVLSPNRRRSSGVGIDKAGLGSPSVVEILNRRASLGEISSFSPISPRIPRKTVQIADPKTLEQEVDSERTRDYDRENGRSVMEREADHGEEENATLNLKEMISSLTPKKKSLRGRKSLHVGAATGLLGKRPAELDADEDDDEVQSDTKRLRLQQTSPVKNVKLQHPPETAERLTRAAHRGLDQVANIITPSMSGSPIRAQAKSPHGQSRFKDTTTTLSPLKLNDSTKPVVDEMQIPEDVEAADKIHLQDFLNMTNIRFMDLTTTKRRHTRAPLDVVDSVGVSSGNSAPSFEDRVVAGISTLPMLGLFEHQCRELKDYISEGRRTVRAIEAATWDDNPPLFKEYIAAAADVKLIMDNQLKNVKTHARLESKGEWYSWRTTLLNTIREDLLAKQESLQHDANHISKQEALLEKTLPQIVRQAEDLELEEAELQLAAQELADCDPEELSLARQQLISLDADIANKQQLISSLQKQLHGKEADIEGGLAAKQALQAEIKAAEVSREACRGWTAKEVDAYKAKADALEAAYGWTITGVSGTVTSMTYHRAIELVFDASAYQSQGATGGSQAATIDLWYIANSRQHKPIEISPEQDFLLQCIRDHIRAMPPRSTSIKDLLQAVNRSWDLSDILAQHVRSMRLTCSTVLKRNGDGEFRISADLLIRDLVSKVVVQWDLSCKSLATMQPARRLSKLQTSTDCIAVQCTPSVRVVYGERFNEAKMADFLINRCGTELAATGKMSWGDAVAELGDKLLARGRK